MRDVVRLTPADSRRAPWRNGRGVTEEIAIWPEGASFAKGDFDGRISKAGVTEPGPFSAFPGFDRVIVVTQGAGLLLSHGDLSHGDLSHGDLSHGDLSHGASAPPARVLCLEPYSFSGDWPTMADLPGGPVADFNVIVRRGRCRAEVSVVRVPRFGGHAIAPHAVTGDLFVHVLSGGVCARVLSGVDLGKLGPGDSLWVRDARPADSLDLRRWPFDGDVEALRAGPATDEHPPVVLVVRITPV